MFIHSSSVFLTDPVKDGHVLKDELKRYTEVHFRRVNKFVILSLIGAHKSVFGKELDRRTSIYLTTERGNLGDTENVLHQIYRKQSLPMPYNFINTMSNTASFYVSQGLNVEGRNISISSQNLSFERGLELLKVDMGMGLVHSALIGGVDEVNWSEVHFERKYGLSYDSVRQVEGSCWLYFRSSQDGAIGELSAVRSFPSREEAMAWLVSETRPSPTHLAFGMAVREDERNIWKKAVRHEHVHDYVNEHGYFDSSTAGGVCLFMRDCPGSVLVHINKNFQDQYVIAVVRRY
jgi:hypothetical protein